MRLSRIRLTDDLHDLVTLPRTAGNAAEPVRAVPVEPLLRPRLGLAHVHGPASLPGSSDEGGATPRNARPGRTWPAPGRQGSTRRHRPRQRTTPHAVRILARAWLPSWHCQQHHTA